MGRHIAELEEDGYTILRDVLPESELEAARKAIQETLAAEESVAKKFGLQTEDLNISFNAQGKHPFFYGFMVRNPEPMETGSASHGGGSFRPRHRDTGSDANRPQRPYPPRRPRPRRLAPIHGLALPGWEALPDGGSGHILYLGLQ